MLEGRLVALRVIIHDFEAELLTPNCAHVGEDIIHRRCAMWTRGGQFFVRVGNREATLVVLDHFGARVSRRDPCAKAAHVESGHIAFAFAFDHPLGEHEANAATLGEASHDATSRPVVTQSRDGADKRVAVWCESEGAVDDGFDACFFKDGEAFEGELNRGLNLV